MGDGRISKLNASPPERSYKLTELAEGRLAKDMAQSDNDRSLIAANRKECMLDITEILQCDP